MVVFTCGYCGDSVNKPKVEKHYSTKCRGRAPNLSCMDCFKDFYGQDHEAHTKCVTEEQRYAASGFVASAKKGETKQSAWVDLVQGVLAEQPAASAGVLRILQDVSKHSNTPRKKAKFVNFVKNVSGHRTSPADIDGAWELIAVKLDQLKAANQKCGNSKPENELKEAIAKENGDVSTLDDSIQTNGDEITNLINFENAQEPEEKELKTKKQRKELKKKRKYEAELHAAAAPPPEDDTEGKTSKKKGKDKHHESKVEESNAKNENIQNENTELSGEKAEECKSKKNKKRMNSENVDEAFNKRVKKDDSTCYDTAEEHKTKKSKKLKNEETTQLEEQGNVQTLSEVEPVPTGSFDWHGVILSILQKKGGELMYKRLQKKVLCEYAAATGREADDRAADRLAKKLRSAKNVRIDKNRVVLVE